MLLAGHHPPTRPWSPANIRVPGSPASQQDSHLPGPWPRRPNLVHQRTGRTEGYQHEDLEEHCPGCRHPQICRDWAPTARSATISHPGYGTIRSGVETMGSKGPRPLPGPRSRWVDLEPHYPSQVRTVVAPPPARLPLASAPKTVRHWPVDHGRARASRSRARMAPPP
jgi:hypothetical protein